MRAVHEFSVAVSVVSARAERYEGEQIAVDDWNSDRWTGKVVLRFKTPGGSFVRTVKASAPSRDDEADGFTEMESLMLGHLRRHGVALDRIEWSLPQEPTEPEAQPQVSTCVACGGYGHDPIECGSDEDHERERRDHPCSACRATGVVPTEGGDQ